MRIADFDYQLPENLIAQQPITPRDAARMLVVNRANQSWQDSSFTDFPSFVQPNDAVVVNNTRVFPARLIGKKESSGGQVEVFLISEVKAGVWEALVKPARRIRVGMKITFGQTLRAEVLDLMEDGRRVIRLECEGSIEDQLEKLGQTPLPPYIKRPAGSLAEDRERYQTVYARQRGAIAAPTAGLHFTPEILAKVSTRKARLVEITLHVGYGTFEPVRASSTEEHSVAPERYEITERAATAINETRQLGGRIIAVGTTTARALESAVSDSDSLIARNELARLTIGPGHRFRAVDALLTNFHLPQSSLLVLVAAFAGYELIMQAYRHAVAAKYRFYSYGDCMLII